MRESDNVIEVEQLLQLRAIEEGGAGTPPAVARDLRIVV